MRKFLLFCLLSASVLASCATHANTQALSHSPQEEERALRSALEQASEQVNPLFFSSLPLETYLGENAKAMAEHPEIPLMQERLEQWKESMEDVFKETTEQNKRTVQAYAATLSIDNPDKLMDNDESMSLLLENQMGDTWLGSIEKELVPLLSEPLEALDAIASDYRIWARGKQATAQISYPDINLPTADDYCSLFHDNFLAELQKEERDVRTTPRPLGTGSLYEFFRGGNQ